MTYKLPLCKFVCMLIFLMGTYNVLGGAISNRANRVILTKSSPTASFSGSEYLDPERKYDIAWELDSESGVILFAVVVETNEYVGLGLSSDGAVKGADVFIGGSEKAAGFTTDFHVGEDDKLIGDKSQDWKLLGAEKTGKFTNLIFSRKLNTCDENDLEITNKTLHVLWNTGKYDKLTSANTKWNSRLVTLIPEHMTWPRYECNGEKADKIIEDWYYTDRTDIGSTGPTELPIPTSEGATSEGSSIPTTPEFNDTLTTTPKCDRCGGNNGVIVNVDVDIDINVNTK